MNIQRLDFEVRPGHFGEFGLEVRAVIEDVAVVGDVRERARGGGRRDVVGGESGAGGVEGGVVGFGEGFGGGAGDAGVVRFA